MAMLGAKSGFGVNLFAGFHEEIPGEGGQFDLYGTPRRGSQTGSGWCYRVRAETMSYLWRPNLRFA